MKISYIDILKDSWNFTWKYKLLWVFGFILAIFSGGSGSSGYSNFSSNTSTSSRTTSYSSTSSSKVLTDFSNELHRITQQPWFWPLVLAILFFLLVLLIVNIYLTTTAKTALILAVKHEQRGSSARIKIAKLWGETSKYFWRVFGVDFCMGVLGLALALVVFLPFICLSVIPFLGCLVCFFIPLLIPIFLLFALWVLVATREVIINESGVFDAISNSFTKIKKNFREWFIASLVSILPALIFGAIFFIAFIILAVIFIGIPVVLMISSQMATWAIIVFVLCVIIFMVISSIIEAPYQVLSSVYWSKVYLAIEAGDKGK